MITALCFNGHVAFLLTPRLDTIPECFFDCLHFVLTVVLDTLDLIYHLKLLTLLVRCQLSPRAGTLTSKSQVRLVNVVVQAQCHRVGTSN